MILLDVNVWLPAMRSDAEHHETIVDWLDAVVKDGDRIGVSELALSAVVRIATHPKVFAIPSTSDEALDFCAQIIQRPDTVVVRPGVHHWDIFDRLVRASRSKGNHIADAYHAALAVESNSVLATMDRGLARFPGVRLLDPLQAA
jgi:toxin-antitoxin system PIN domain toxin